MRKFVLIMLLFSLCQVVYSECNVSFVNNEQLIDGNGDLSECGEFTDSGQSLERWISLIYIAVGIIWIIGTLLLKEKISNIYENMKGLNERQKKHFRTIIVKLPGIVNY